ncbi:glycoside hydrolase family 81 protein [[Candida] arabinofermentans NRRL YB-2248]|uniref:glucan endo-1,3-beta-D-glucosidase n=1 Tax=[Candida] arabinofermentans NRRL YB-2248 TaxID=983967 RepID=A0A1E4SZ80_9ASCO|nr:glycoside hydrolase family 81 protein [[Candida] arabinofermentans NRRL YB-2248]
MRLRLNILATTLLMGSVLSKIHTVTTTASTTTTTRWITESLLIETVYDNTPSTIILGRHTADTTIISSEKDSTFNPETTSKSSLTTVSTVGTTSGTSEAIITPENRSSSTIDVTLPLASILSSASTSTSTIFSTSLPSDVSFWSGTVISTVKIASASTLSISTKSSSLSNFINTKTLTEDVTITTASTTSSVNLDTTSSTFEGYSNSSFIDLSSSSTTLKSTVNLAKSTESSSTIGSTSLTSSINTSSSSSKTKANAETTSSVEEDTRTTSTASTSTSSSSSETNTAKDTSTSSTRSTSSTSESSSSTTRTETKHTTSSTRTSKATSSSSTSTSSSTVIDLFQVISTDSPPDVFARDELYLELNDGVDNEDTPYETNKFYANLMVGDQDQPAFSFPYSFFYLTSTYYGLAMSHTLESSQTFGYSSDDSTTAEYYSNPILVGSLVFSATTLASSNIDMDLSDMKEMSVLVTLSDGTDDNFIDFPLVQGMGMGSAIYNGALVPQINSQVGISSFTEETSTALADGILKYRVTLYNDVDWLIYVTVPDEFTTDDFDLTYSDAYTLVGSSAIDGLIIQAAPAPDSDLDGYYDEAAGMYPLSCAVEGTYDTSSSDSATYKFAYTTEGSSASSSIIVFALQHHIDVLDSSTSSSATGIKLYSPTKGYMYGFLTNTLSMEETLNTDVSFLPFAEIMTDSSLSYTSEQLQLLAEVANSELSVDIASLVSEQDSNYYSGKVLDKYAQILLVVSDIIGDDDVTTSTLSALKTAFEEFTNNEQYYPLMYDTRYKGVTSTASQSGDTGADFGSATYNDHHFHYGYFIHAAAVVGYVDANNGGTWASDNKDWVNSLVRDVINPSSDDSYFPVSRMFDWFNGHSWASGLTSAGDGLNQESSSEDYHCYYGMKLWGSVIGDSSMEHRGDLMLSIMKRSMNYYYYFHDDNTVEPSEIIGNKVAGILFQNKITYTTYFGTNTEYIHGIHMLPITAASGLIREESFVKEEWTSKLSSIIDSVSSGWTGILRLNQALYDPTSSYSFFSGSSWSDDYLDDGQSRTWSLAFSAGIMNSS